MILPADDEFLTNLILQRTKAYIAICGKGPLALWTQTGRRDHLLAELRRHGAVDDFVNSACAEIAGDVAELVSLIGDRAASRVVSVGCGSGIAEAILCHRLDVGAMLLVDTEQGGRGHGMQADGAGYSRLTVAAQVMRDNGASCSIELWNPARKPAHDWFQFDVMFSLYALGFHFPVSTYIKFMSQNARPGALSIYHQRQQYGAAPILTCEALHYV